MVVAIIIIYQRIVSPALKQLLGLSSLCRFTPSCSEYAKIAIQEHGLVRGSYLALLRLLQCQPLSKQKLEVKSLI